MQETCRLGRFQVLFFSFLLTAEAYAELFLSSDYLCGGSFFTPLGTAVQFPAHPPLHAPQEEQFPPQEHFPAFRSRIMLRIARPTASTRTATITRLTRLPVSHESTVTPPYSNHQIILGSRFTPLSAGRQGSEFDFLLNGQCIRFAIGLEQLPAHCPDNHQCDRKAGNVHSA